MNIQDFQAMLSDSEKGKVLTDGVKALVAYEAEKKSVNESVKETLDDIVAHCKVEDKKDQAAIKKYIKKAASAYSANEVNRVLSDQTAVEMLLMAVDPSIAQQD